MYTFQLSEVSGVSFDDIVVESDLNVRKPLNANRGTPVRQSREIVIPQEEVYLIAPQGRLYRVRRQFGGFNPNQGFG